MPAKRPYSTPFESLLIIKIPVLYKNIPTTIPIEIAVTMWIAIPAAITDCEEYTPITRQILSRKDSMANPFLFQKLF